MAKAIKCDLTGAAEDGEGCKQVVVQISETFRVVVTPQVTDNGTDWRQAELAQKGVHIIEAALSGIAGKGAAK